MTSTEKYQEYVKLCDAHGLRPLSFTAWSNLFPLDMQYA
jgi:hypothetical protein